MDRLEDAHAALVRATEARDRLQPDELDSLGGLCTFSRPRQLYYAADAPVLELPQPKRIHGIVTSVEHVHTALRAIEDQGRDATELAGAIEGFTSERLAIQR